MTTLRKTCFAAAFSAVSLWLAASAGAQGLALSYNLNVNSDPAQPAVYGAANRCSGFNWVSSLGACTRDLLTRVSAGSRDAAPESPPTFEPAVPNSELPTLGVPVPESILRGAGGKEALIGNAKAVDVLFRFGSKYRLRSAEEGWEWYRFTDVGDEIRRKNSVHKAVGVELLVPFQ